VLHWPDCRNVRDVGGLPTDDGGRTRHGALIRADDLAHLTTEGLAAFRAAGVSRVIDLRGSVEIAKLPGPFADDPAYRWLPFIDEEADRHRDPEAEATDLATYRGSVQRNARNIVAGLRAVVDAPPGTVVVHCSAGRDRTGMLVGFALTVAGVAAAEVAADYAATADQNGCEPETMLGLLEYVAQRYGDVAEYLMRHGMREAELATLRDRLTR
jgi:protein-tyrosine phosphatase